ncbi:DUF4183 domain-containing protein [Salipaludibacillus sp. HK11]|uniref:DUF4183 domain-containing protein n=1 Tax=Salipaludibacillus sp. HK11 TaxID=3394320 RepID=UPI0039FCD0E4
MDRKIENNNDCCYLCDKNGNRLSPTDLNAVKIKIVSITEANENLKHIELAISGFIISESLKQEYDHCPSSPVPFLVLKSFSLKLPEKNFICFQIKKNSFQCTRFTKFNCQINFMLLTEIYTPIIISLEGCYVFPRSNKTILPLEIKEQRKDSHCLHVDCLHDSFFHPITSDVSLTPQINDKLEAESSLYYAKGNGEKRVFTNVDEICNPNTAGLLNPEQVTFCNLFVNAVLQNPNSYNLEEGKLTFLTNDIPEKNVPIITQFVTVFSHNGEVLKGEIDFFHTSANGTAMEFPTKTLPTSDTVTFVDLFINGVLQPQENYKVTNGSLLLTTEIPPRKGVPIILQYVKISNSIGVTVRGESSTFCVASDGISKIFSEKYHCLLCFPVPFIDCPHVSYRNLFINGVLQPNDLYNFRHGKLQLKTSDAPIKKAPIILQGLSFFDCE